MNLITGTPADWVTPTLELNDDQRAAAFEAGCVARGLCPLCLASGARGSCALDMLGSCSACGYPNQMINHE